MQYSVKAMERNKKTMVLRAFLLFLGCGKNKVHRITPPRETRWHDNQIQAPTPMKVL